MITICKECGFTKKTKQGLMMGLCLSPDAPFTDWVQGFKECKHINDGNCKFFKPVSDSSEKITLPSDRYTIQELWQLLGQLDWMVKPRSFRDHCGPDKQKEHDCLMGAKMFLEYIKGKHKGNL